MTDTIEFKAPTQEEIIRLAFERNPQDVEHVELACANGRALVYWNFQDPVTGLCRDITPRSY